MHTLKLVMIGPTESGKTTIANFLADATEIPYDYRPTQGVRILEFEINDMEVNNERISKDIELWDCSGNHKFKNCWSAVRKDAHGVILVYSAKIQDSSKKLKEFYDYFVSGAKLGPNNCVIFFFDPDNSASSAPKIISSSFANVSHVKCNVDDSGDKLKADFRLFLSTLMTKLHENKEEKLILSDNILFAK
ncbi:LOW QUALITY PROTEIN: intraflagellar transport protein 22 homolog [Pogonomyrmex barbatus]|uniref:LOW QUALITY PROTEIN: intraflagellar transport protein 22 homolog n=1 Tax=Pogonomyrmex barbatus TaxID=144034 RepID=A0A6I9WPW0_9HYME|nr:LOW QUALITY PROTEIN: intraflagellar transport protein 22 homolog [Pogonomyrmex barbatus]